MFVDNAGEFGLIQDLPDYQLPDSAWSSVTNIRFRDGYAEKFLGHSKPYGTPTVAPYFLLPVQSDTVQYWIYAGLSAVYVTQGTTHSDISRASGYNANAKDGWNGGVLGNIAILNNGAETPQYWANNNPGTLLADLPNWPANTTCKVLKPYGNFLIALDVKASGTRNPFLVKWSHPAEFGSVPSSWDEADTTLQAGENTIQEQGGYIVDGGRLGENFIIYREKSIHIMRFIGGRFIFDFDRIAGEIGMFSRNCFVELPDKTHCFLSANDLMVHNGGRPQSIIKAKMRDTLFNDIDTTNGDRTFLAANHKKKEVWICYPESGQSFASKALVWNYEEDKFGFRALPGCRYAAFDVVDSTLEGTINANTNTINSQTQIINARLYDPINSNLLLADTSNTKLLQADDTNQFDGTSFTATLQRTGITFGDLSKIKEIKEIRPVISSTGTPAITVKVGNSDAPEGTVTWGTGQTFTVGTDYKLNFDNDENSGRLLAYEFSSTGDVDWKLHGFDITGSNIGKQ